MGFFLLPKHPVDGCRADDGKGCQDRQDGLPFPPAHLHYFAPITARTVKDLSARILQDPFQGMKPAAFLHFVAAPGTLHGRQGLP